MTYDVRRYGLVPGARASVVAAGAGAALAALAGAGPLMAVAGAGAGFAVAVAGRLAGHLSMCALEDMADRMDPGGSSRFEHP